MSITESPPPPMDTLGRSVVARDPNASNFAVPHFMTFASIFNGTSRSYWGQRFDEAMRNSREDALAMRRDTFYQSLLSERYKAVSGLPWHIKVPDEKDPEQKMVQQALTTRLESTLGLTRINRSMLEAIWYGRYGIQPRWKWFPPNRHSEGRQVFGMDDWYPVNGDKITHRWDGTPMLQINPIKAAEFERQGYEVVYSNLGMYLVMGRQWREYLIVHKHEIDDADYYEAEMAEGRFGVGVRSRVYWLDFLKREFLEWITAYMERIGLGITIWYYDASNPDAKIEVENAAEESGRKANLLVPVTTDGKGGKRGLVERVETPTGGVEALRSLIDYFDKIIERYIVGQEGSASATSSSGHSNNGSSEFMQDTKKNISREDAKLLGETYTGSDREPGLLSVMQRWTFPETRGKFQAQFVFTIDTDKDTNRVTAAQTLWNMGVPLKADEVRAAAGFTKPAEGDEIIKKPDEQPQPGAPGAVPSGAAPAGPDGPSLPDMLGQAGAGAAPAPEEPGPTDAPAPDAQPDQQSGGTDLMRLLGYSHAGSDGAMLYARNTATAKPVANTVEGLVQAFRASGGHVKDIVMRLSEFPIDQLHVMAEQLQNDRAAAMAHRITSRVDGDDVQPHDVIRRVESKADTGQPLSKQEKAAYDRAYADWQRTQKQGVME